MGGNGCESQTKCEGNYPRGAVFHCLFSDVLCGSYQCYAQEIKVSLANFGVFSVRTAVVTSEKKKEDDANGLA